MAKFTFHMMTSSNGNIFRVAGHLCGEFTGPLWIPRTNASDTELWCFLLICVWINDWVNNRGAGALRRYRAHYDIIVMTLSQYVFSNPGHPVTRLMWYYSAKLYSRSKRWPYDIVETWLFKHGLICRSACHSPSYQEIFTDPGEITMTTIAYENLITNYH